MEFRLLFTLEARCRKIRLVMVEVLLTEFRDTRAQIDLFTYKTWTKFLSRRFPARTRLGRVGPCGHGPANQRRLSLLR